MPTTILRPYVLGLRNRFHRSQAVGHEIKRDIILVLVATVLMGLIYTCTILTLKAFPNPFAKELFTLKLIELLSYVLFVLLLVSNTVASMGNIFTSQNVNIFLSAPVATPRLFFAKIIETTVETGTMCMVFLTPVSLALWHTYHLPLHFFVRGIFILIPFLLIPAALSIIFATAFAQFASVVWKRGNFFLCSAAILGFLVLRKLVQMLDGVHFQQGEGYRTLIQAIGLFDNPNPLWFPSRWAGDLLTYLVVGEVDDPQLKLFLLYGTAVGSMALAYLVFDLLLLRVRSMLATHEPSEPQNAQKVLNSDLSRRFIEFFYLRLPIDCQARAIIIKDLTSLVRDRGQALLLLLYLGMSLAYLVIVRFLGAAIAFQPGTLRVWWGVLACVNILFTGFVLTCVMTRLVYPSISLEGKAFWILLTGPIKLRRILAAKFWCWLPLSLVLAGSLVAAGVLAINPMLPLLGVSLFVAVCMSIGCTGLAVGVGSTFASFEWESPNQISVGFGTLVLLLSSFLLVLITTVPGSVLAFLTAVPGARVKAAGDFWPLLMAVCAAVTLALNLAIAYYACKKGAQSLAERYGG